MRQRLASPWQIAPPLKELLEERLREAPRSFHESANGVKSYCVFQKCFPEGGVLGGFFVFRVVFPCFWPEVMVFLWSVLMFFVMVSSVLCGGFKRIEFQKDQRQSKTRNL